ncbi:MAG TPA: MaoC family dehydratase [bacterium]|nr:MaoC family dehydratase [bacterium]
MKIRVAPQKEKAPALKFDAGRVKAPQYGRWLEDFREGDVYVHPRGLTIHGGIAQQFATSFHEANPLYLNAEFAKAMGHPNCPASPQLVFNIVLSLGVQNDSEKAIANLGYYDAQFVRFVYPHDTIRAMTKVLNVKDRGEGKPGIVSIRTVGINQKDELVLQYDRKIMVARGPDAATKKREESNSTPTVALGFPELKDGAFDVPVPHRPPRNLTGAHTWFEDFKAGDVIVHANGRTITDEHVAWTYRVGNTHPLHYDRDYSKSLKGAMSGEPIVYGGLVFAWLTGVAGRDTTENAIADIGFTEGYHTAPAVTGDTVHAITRVLDAERVMPAAADGPIEAGVVTMQLIGVKNITSAAALERYGADLFVKENGKEKKIPEKIFEIERRVLLRTRT